MSDLYIWWTSNDDWDRVSMLRSGEVALPSWPLYLTRVFASRGAPSNAERILAHPMLGEVNIEMVVGSPEHTISIGAVGIVVRAEDVAAVIPLPGFVTDTQMNFVARAPFIETEDTAADREDSDGRVVPLRRAVPGERTK